MTAYKKRPRGLPAIDRLTADQLRSEVLRLAGNIDHLMHEAEQLRFANVQLRNQLREALEKAEAQP